MQYTVQRIGISGPIPHPLQEELCNADKCRFFFAEIGYDLRERYEVVPVPRIAPRGLTYAAARGAETWHLLNLDTPSGTRAVALCGAVPAGGAWASFAYSLQGHEPLCPECEEGGMP